MTLAPRAATAALAAALLAPAVHAQGVPLDDESLGKVWGQALLSLTNTSNGGYDFTRLTLDGTVNLSANLRDISLGNYARTGGTGSADIDISTLSFGRSDLDEAHRTVAITNPYIEFVYKNANDPATREVVGMRLGFGGIAGDIGLKMNTVSGSLLIDTGVDANGNHTYVDSHNSPDGGVRWTGACATCTTLLNQIGGVTAGNASGASRDFFLSVLKEAVPYLAAEGMTAPQTAASGFWLNWTDRLTALNTSSLVPPNVARSGP